MELIEDKIKHLEAKHRDLDSKIKEAHSRYLSDELMVKMKQEPKIRPGPMEQAKKHTLKKKCKVKDKAAMCSKNKDLGKCDELDCCAWVNYKTGAKCMHGSKTGPSIRENKLGYDYYYYKNKKYDV